MNPAIDEVIDEKQYCLASINPLTGETHKGDFLFGKPEEAREAISMLRQQYPHCLFWLEDRECNRVEIPKR